jgi:hypothetical protein
MPFMLLLQSYRLGQKDEEKRWFNHWLLYSRDYHDRYHLSTFRKRLDREANILEGLK